MVFILSTIINITVQAPQSITAGRKRIKKKKKKKRDSLPGVVKLHFHSTGTNPVVLPLIVSWDYRTNVTSKAREREKDTESSGWFYEANRDIFGVMYDPPERETLICHNSVDKKRGVRPNKRHDVFRV